MFLILTAAALFSGVAMGAFGAHGLRGHLSEYAMDIYRTAVEYHMWHGLGLGLVAVLLQRQPNSRPLYWCGGLLMVGILIFSGSLYLLAISGLRWLGAITPVGGLCFLAAWILLGWYARKHA